MRRPILWGPGTSSGDRGGNGRERLISGRSDANRVPIRCLPERSNGAVSKTSGPPSIARSLLVTQRLGLWGVGEPSSPRIPSAPGAFGSKVGSTGQAVVFVAGTTSLMVTCPALIETASRSGRPPVALASK